MKIIFISGEIPYPANSGGRIVIYKRLQYLAANNDIYFYCIIDKESENEGVYELKKICKEVHLYNRNKQRSKISTLLNLWKGPYACISRSIKDMRVDISFCYLQNSIDYVLVEFPQMLGAVPVEILNSGKVVLEQHNIEYITMANLAESITNPIKSIIFRLEAKRLMKWEDKYYNDKIKLFTFVSLEDKCFFEKRYPDLKTYHFPIGSEIQPIENKEQKSYNICYFGKMSYPPNAEASKWFVDKVFSLVRYKIPNAKFYIVGKDPLDSLFELAESNTNVIVTGTVEDIRNYYSLADVVVVPLFHGGGVKVKVLEALGYGKLVISTNKGIEGTDFRTGKDLLTADTEEEMANLIIDVFNDPSKYREIRNQGLKTIEDRYTWEAIIHDFEQFLEGMI